MIKIRWCCVVFLSKCVTVCVDVRNSSRSDPVYTSGYRVGVWMKRTAYQVQIWRQMMWLLGILRYFNFVLVQGLRNTGKKNVVGLNGVPAEDQIGHLSNTNLRLYRWTNSCAEKTRLFNVCSTNDPPCVSRGKKWPGYMWNSNLGRHPKFASQARLLRQVETVAHCTGLCVF